MAKHKEIDFQKWEKLEDYGEKMKAAVWAASQAVKRWLDLADELMDDAQANESIMYHNMSALNENLSVYCEGVLGLNGFEAPVHVTDHGHHTGGLDALDGMADLEGVDVNHYQKAE